MRTPDAIQYTTTEIPTSEVVVVGGKKRSQNARAQTRSKKCAKLTHTTVHETSEEAGRHYSAATSRRRPMTKAHEGAFEGTINAEELRPRGRQMAILCQYT